MGSFEDQDGEEGAQVGPIGSLQPCCWLFSVPKALPRHSLLALLEHHHWVGKAPQCCRGAIPR